MTERYSGICTFNSATESGETVSNVTRIASFFDVRASRRECARTKAPVGAVSRLSDKIHNLETAYPVDMNCS